MLSCDRLFWDHISVHEQICSPVRHRESGTDDLFASLAFICGSNLPPTTVLGLDKCPEPKRASAPLQPRINCLTATHIMSSQAHTTAVS